MKIDTSPVPAASGDTAPYAAAAATALEGLFAAALSALLGATPPGAKTPTAPVTTAPATSAPATPPGTPAPATSAPATPPGVGANAGRHAAAGPEGAPAPAAVPGSPSPGASSPSPGASTTAPATPAPATPPGVGANAGRHAVAGPEGAPAPAPGPEGAPAPAPGTPSAPGTAAATAAPPAGTGPSQPVVAAVPVPGARPAPQPGTALDSTHGDPATLPTAPAVLPASAAVSAAPQPAPPAPAYAPAAPAAVAPQLVTAMTPVLHGADGSYSVHLQLHPDDLGPVHLTVQLYNGQVDVHLHAAELATRDLLRDALPGLRTELQAQGLDPGELAVGAEDMADRSPPRQDLPDRRAGGRRGGTTPTAPAAPAGVAAPVALPRRAHGADADLDLLL